MANEENLKPFKKGYDERRENNGRPKGSRNRSTIVREALETDIEYEHPLTGVKSKMKAVDAMVLSMLKSALEDRNVQAFKELMDSGYGKILQEVHNVNRDISYEEALKIREKRNNVRNRPRD